MQRAVVHALAQHVNDSALADLVGETGEELLPVDVLAVPIVGDAQFPERLRLRGLQELEQLRHFECVGAVVILGVAGKPARTSGLGGGKGIGRFRDHALGGKHQPIRAGHVPHDQRFQAFLAGIGGRHVTLSAETS
jgi:hypothetical protein